MPSMRQLLAAAPIALLILAGCATYERRPLHLEKYAEELPSRQIDVEPVLQFAQALTDEEPTQPFDLSDGLSLPEAEAVALVFNPQLRRVRAQADVPLATAREAGWWPDPQFEAAVLLVGNRGRRTRYEFDRLRFVGVNTDMLLPNNTVLDGIDYSAPGYRKVPGNYVSKPWTVEAGLNITIPISGRLAVEKDWAWAEYDTAWRQILVAEWELLTRLRDAWLSWSTTGERIAVTEEYVGRLERIVGTADRLAAAGEMKSTDARVLQIELSRRRMDLQLLQAQAAQQRLELFAMLGVDPEASVELQEDVFLPTIDIPLEERRDTLLKRHPRVLAVQADYESAEQRLRLEIRNQYPDLTIGPSFSWEEGLSRLGMGWGLPIPVWNHNRQAVAEATAEREAARVRAAVVVESVFSELAQAEIRQRYATERRELLLDNVAPLVDRQVEETRKLLAFGEVEVLLLRDAISRSLDTKLAVLDATLAEAQARNALKQMLEPRWITPSQAEIEENE